MGRKNKTPLAMRPKGVALRQDQIDRLNKLSRETGLGVSWLVRRGVDAILDGQVGIIQEKEGERGSVGRDRAPQRRNKRRS